MRTSSLINWLCSSIVTRRGFALICETVEHKIKTMKLMTSVSCIFSNRLNEDCGALRVRAIVELIC